MQESKKMQSNKRKFLVFAAGLLNLHNTQYKWSYIPQ